MSLNPRYKLVLRPEFPKIDGVRSLNGLPEQPFVDNSGNIDMSGNFLLVRNIEVGIEDFTTNGNKGIVNIFSDSTNNSRRYCLFNPRINNENYIAGSITGNPAQVSYNTMSDRRVKTNITSIGNENKYKSNNNDYSWLESVNALNPYMYSFDSEYVGAGNENFVYKQSIDSVDISVNYQGFIADEVQEIYPPAVTGISGEVTNGTSQYQQLDMTKLIPMMVGAIKELSARVTELENPK